MKRSGSAENKLPAMACNTSGSTLVALTNQAAPSSRRLSTLCFAGTVMRLNATCTCQMFRSVALSKNDQIFQGTWEPAFRKSRWFTRGWTLQELIAPASVEFFSVEGQATRWQEITRATNSRDNRNSRFKLFKESPLSHFSVDERMSWAAKRETKRKEDKAYSLLGIFDIHMPLIYGEGGRRRWLGYRRRLKTHPNVKKVRRPWVYHAY